MDDYKVIDTDLLAAFRVVPQPGVPPRKRAPLLLLSRQPEPGLQSGRMDLPALIDTRAVDTRILGSHTHWTYSKKAQT